MRGKKELLEKITKKEKVKPQNDATVDCDLTMALLPAKRSRPQDFEESNSYSAQFECTDGARQNDRRLDNLEAIVKEACARQAQRVTE